MKRRYITADELEKFTYNKSVAEAIKELAWVLSGRSRDMPHVVQAPLEFGANIFSNGPDITQRVELACTSTIKPMTLNITVHQARKIMELSFYDWYERRLLTVEIEYAVPES